MLIISHNVKPSKNEGTRLKNGTEKYSLLYKLRYKKNLRYKD